MKVSAVSWGEFDANENKALPDGMEPRCAAEVRPGDLIMSRANIEELVARSVIATNPPPHLMLSDKHVRLEWTDENLKWFANLFNETEHARSYFAAVATGTGALMKNVTRDAILRLPIPVPPPAEQGRILLKLDELRAGFNVLANPALPDEAAQESNLPSDGLRRPAGFEDRIPHQGAATPQPV